MAKPPEPRVSGPGKDQSPPVFPIKLPPGFETPADAQAKFRAAAGGGVVPMREGFVPPGTEPGASLDDLLGKVEPGEDEPPAEEQSSPDAAPAADTETAEEQPEETQEQEAPVSQAQAAAMIAKALKKDGPSPLLAWYELKHGHRDLLCLLCVMRGWDFRQERRSIDEVLLTEAEYDAHMAYARKIYDMAKKYGREKNRAVTFICHPRLLIGMLVMKPNAAQTSQISEAIKSTESDERTTAALIRSIMAKNSLAPKNGSTEMHFLMTEAPSFFADVAPFMYLEAAGVDQQGLKKRG